MKTFEKRKKFKIFTQPHSPQRSAQHTTPQHTAHSSQHRTQHSTQHTAHSTQHTAHSTQHTAHSTQHTAHSTQHTASCSLPIRYQYNIILHSAPGRLLPTASFLHATGTAIATYILTRLHLNWGCWATTFRACMREHQLEDKFWKNSSFSLLTCQDISYHGG